MTPVVLLYKNEPSSRRIPNSVRMCHDDSSNTVEYVDTCDYWTHFHSSCIMILRTCEVHVALTAAMSMNEYSNLAGHSQCLIPLAPCPTLPQMQLASNAKICV